MEFSAGVAAGIIAAAFLIASLQSSYWPTLLRADVTRPRGVRTSIGRLSLASPVLAILIGIASVVTPLGLYEADQLEDTAIQPHFQYAPDSSAMSSGTSTRGDHSFTRTCYLGSVGMCVVPCSFTEDEVESTMQNEGSDCEYPAMVNTTVPNVLIERFSSGTSLSKTTVSNFFDIEWRQMTYQSQPTANNGEPTPAGSFQFLESFTSSDSIHVVEGLVVDATKGSIGFRNHTWPVVTGRGVTWTEDLLFLEPEVDCINNNISIDFNFTNTAGNVSDTRLSELKLVDHGGFADINITAPYDDRRDGPNKPDLRSRAYIAAWMTNAYSMLTLNVTNPRNDSEGIKAFSYIDSELGKSFKLPKPSTKVKAYQSLELLLDLGGIFDLDGLTKDFALKNPWDIENNNFSIPSDGPSLIFDDGSSWSSPLYTCASTVKATVKTVKFFHNGRNENIDGLKVESISDKDYATEEDMPLWGVEDTYLTLSELTPIWGLIDTALEGAENISTIRQPWFYLLGASLGVWNPGLVLTGTRDNLAGGIAPIAAMNAVTGRTTDMSVDAAISDFTAAYSKSLWLKWKTLSSSESTVGNILKLLWTDVAASAMVGTKGVLGHGNAQTDKAVGVPVFRVVRKVQYRFLFGIPASIITLCLVAITVLMLVAVLSGRSSLRIMDRRLKQTSLGRALIMTLSGETSDILLPSKEWSETYGEIQMDLGNCVDSSPDVASHEENLTNTEVETVE
ncbi:unnamed protein product [Clonostachys byssicola]|uniref:Uncharacterized protein n=1 Tax=Clonostachys byssicola TaxID=160290 RepID=A0A9N9UA31_9HYPO|nr:unnamed protein product [Clonostachys byssicola]